MKKTLASLLVCLLCVTITYGQTETRKTSLLVMPVAIGLGYKLSDWLYGAPFTALMQAQLVFRDKFILEVPLQTLSFKDAIFQDQEFSRLFTSSKVRHGIMMAGIGAGYNLRILQKHRLQFTGGAAFVNYSEPYVNGPSGGWFLSSYSVEHYSHKSSGLYIKIQYNIFLSDRAYLSFGSTAVSCRDLSYGTVYGGCSVKLR